MITEAKRKREKMDRPISIFLRLTIIPLGSRNKKQIVLSLRMIAQQKIRYPENTEKKILFFMTISKQKNIMKYTILKISRLSLQ